MAELCERVCGKVVYRDCKQARKAIQSLKRRGVGQVDIMQAYHCGECVGWHVGRNPKKLGGRDRPFRMKSYSPKGKG